MFSTLASRIGLVRGDIVVGKKHFSVLTHTHEKASVVKNIMAGFRKAGIYYLSREAVDMTQDRSFILFCIITPINCVKSNSM